MRSPASLAVLVPVIVLAALVLGGCGHGEPGGNPDYGKSDGTGTSVSAADLQRSWKGTWVTPSTGFTFDLVFSVARNGAVTGTYATPGQAASPGLGGHLMLADGATGAVTGTLTFGSDVIFNDLGELKLSADPGMGPRVLHLKGMFASPSFPGDLGKDMLDVTSGAMPTGAG